jgi:hypothetical protein
VIKDANLSNKDEELERLLMEANELNKIMSKAKNATYAKY